MEVDSKTKQTLPEVIAQSAFQNTTSRAIQENHVIDLRTKATVIDREPDRPTEWIT